MKKHLLILATALLSISTFAQIPNYVPANGLVGWWPFNGNANDESGNNHDGVVNSGSNGTLFYVNDQFGNSASAIEFTSNPGWNQLGPHIELNNSQNILLNSAFTINYFISINSSNQIGEIINKGSDNTPGVFVSRIVNGTLSNSITSGGSVNQSNFPNNTWKMVTVINSSTNQLSLFINGSLTQSSITSDITNLGSNFFFGSMPSGGSNGSYYPFQGKLDDVGFWNRALTACEIQDLYHAQLNSASMNISAGFDQSICSGDPVTLNGSGGSNYQWNNNVVDGQAFTPNQSANYVLNGTDSLGCQGTDTVVVTVLENATSTLTQTALDSYTLNGQTYTQSGTYTQTVPAANGCDSTITLILTLNFTGMDELGTGAKKLVKITDLNGKVIPRRKNTLMLFIYEDGTVERVVEMEE
jgi:hypothetical protein